RYLIFLLAMTMTMEEVVVAGLSVPKIIGGLIFVCAIVNFTHSLRIPRSRIFGFFFLYLFYSILSLIWSYDAGGAIVGLSTYFQIMILGIIIYNHLQHRD